MFLEINWVFRKEKGMCVLKRGGGGVVYRPICLFAFRRDLTFFGDFGTFMRVHGGFSTVVV